MCEIFARHGFTVNLKPGKTSAVLAFRGSGAPALRKKFLLEDKSCDLAVGQQTLKLPLLCSYVHLGVKTTAAAHLDHEVRQRIGQAMSAFHAIRRSLIGNRRLSSQTRCRLVESLLLSKLFFGCGAWSSIPAALLKKPEHTMGIFYREALDQQFWRERPISDEVLYSKYKLLPAKARIARDRLLYAGSIVRDGPEFLWDRLLLLHQGKPEESWLAYLERDIQWLQSLLLNLHEEEWNKDWLSRRSFWQTSPKEWCRLVTRACKIFKAQEGNISMVRSWHRKIFGALIHDGGAKIPIWTEDVEAPITQLNSFRCHCNKSFASKRALAVHQAKAHNMHAPEYKHASGGTCPVCLRHFWSTHRLRQHLAYMPRSGEVNACFSKLQLIEPEQGPPELIKITGDFRGINRLDSVTAAGPAAAPNHWEQGNRQALLRALADLDQQLLRAGVPLQPDHGFGHELRTQLTTASHAWFTDWLRDFPYGPAGVELQEAWMAVLSADPSQEGEALEHFMLWVDIDMVDIWADWGNAEAAQILDTQAADLIVHLDVVLLLRRRTKLQLQFDLQQQPRAAPIPHRPVYRGPANAAERQRRDHVPPGRFSRQGEWKDLLDQAEFVVQPKVPLHVPICRTPHERPTFLVVHLFSGRRRASDFHGHLHRLCEQAPFAVAIVSLDTAISEELGDLRSSSSSWRNLEVLYRSGRIAATLASSPCETFTEARHHPITLPDGTEVEGPRPLRSGRELWGLPHLTLRELRQLQQGSEFALQVAWCATLAVLTGGALISEHPAPP